jgi:hypothetical protein
LLASGQGLLWFVLFAALSAVGVHDLLQTHHAVLRNYPILGHLRFLLEFVRPKFASTSLRPTTRPHLSHGLNAAWSMPAPKANRTNNPLAPCSTSTATAKSG